MSNTKRVLIILLVIIGTPLLGLGFGAIGGARLNDSSGLSSAFGLGIGIAAVVVSLILGPIVSFLTRNAQNQRYSLAGYVIPAVLALLYVLFLSLFG